jgi:hypothetical protein
MDTTVAFRQGLFGDSRQLVSENEGNGKTIWIILKVETPVGLL